MVKIYSTLKKWYNNFKLLIVYNFFKIRNYMAEIIGKINFKFSKTINNQEVFLADEDLAKKSNLGRLFIVLSIDSKERNLNEKIKDLISLIENSYYSSPIADMESALELTCQEVNNNLNDIFNKPDVWYQKFNLLIGVIKKTNLVLSHMGSFSGYLVRQKKISQILSSKNSEKEKKYFSQLTTGKINPDDGLILANLSFFDYFSLDTIKEILANLKAIPATEHFKNLLLEQAKTANVVGVLVKENDQTEKKDDLETQTDKYIQEFYGSKESLKQLENLEQRTGRTLSASNWPDFLKFKKNLFLYLKKPFFIFKKSSELKLPQIKENPVHLKRGLIKEKVSHLGLGFKNILKKIFSNKKFFTSLIIFLILIFIASVGYVSVYKKKADQIKKWQQTLDQAGESKTAADTALIYEDKEKASTLLTEALNVLNSNYPQEISWQSKFDNQKKELTVLLNKLNNIYEANLEIIIEISSGEIKNLWKNKGNWQFMTSTYEIFNLNNDKSTNLLFKGDNLKQVSLYKDNNFIFLNNDNKFSYLEDKKNTSQALTINWAGNSVLSEFNVYGDNLYVLDNSNGTLNKVTQILSSKPALTNWYTGDKEILKGAKEINIDGSVWLVNGNKIIKLYKGKEQAFELAKINQPLGNNLEIYTEIDWSYLYVLDIENKRLLVINKENGAVVRQYLNNELAQASNLLIDDNQNNALMVMANKIYKLAIK